MIKNLSEAKLKTLLIDNGFYEIINNPFTETKCKTSIKIDNPLDSNKEYMRVSLKNSLIENLLYNERRQKDSIKLFEISDVYTNSNIQKKLLGIIATGRVDKNHEDFTKIINEKYLANIFKDKISGNTIFNYENISRSTLNTKYKSPITFLEVELDSSITVNYESNLIKKTIQNLNINQFLSIHRQIEIFHIQLKSIQSVKI